MGFRFTAIEQRMDPAIIAAIMLTGALFGAVVAFILHRRSASRKSNTAAVLVLGDLGRSPRMALHAASLARHDVEVHLCGYTQSQVAPKQGVTVHAVGVAPAFPLPRLLAFVAKTLYQTLQLLYLLLWRLPPHATLLIQNPPAIPVLFCAHINAVVGGARMVVDWHNMGYTLMAMAMGDRHPLVRIAYWFERVFGRGSAGALCVTGQMREWLQQEWGVDAAVLYDCPPPSFRRLDADERAHLMQRLTSPGGELEGMAYAEATPRPVIVTSGTSWTVDEDFSIMLNAARIVEEERRRRSDKGAAAVPPIQYVITGKGPMKAQYEQDIANDPLLRGIIHTAFLKAEDYPRLLGAADVGVCLHTSSSKLDLPMKVVDMYGCSLPVAAIAVDYPCLDELVKEGLGYKFTSAEELAAHIMTLAVNAHGERDELRTNITAAYSSEENRWDANWDRVALPILLPASKKNN